MTSRILVSVGTHEQPFQRLLDGVVAYLSVAGDVEIVVQYGVGKWPQALGVQAVDYFSHEEMTRQLAAADILVTQASPGNVFGALRADAWPLVLGRSKFYREHVDDHQIDFAEAAEELGLGTNIGSIDKLATALRSELLEPHPDRLARCENAVSLSDTQAALFRDRFWDQMSSLMEGGRG